MNHFSTADWVDFTRGLLPPSESSGLQSHLDRGCEECIEALALWGAVFECVSPTKLYRIPDDALKNLTTAYSAQKPWRWLAHVARWAELVFDSFLQPAPAPVRGSALLNRHLIHASEPFVIDLRMEADRTRSRFSLIGQVLNSDHPNEAVRGIEVILLSGDDLVAKASARASGEFDLEGKLEPSLQLFIHIRGQRAIGIILPAIDA